MLLFEHITITVSSCMGSLVQINRVKHLLDVKRLENAIKTDSVQSSSTCLQKLFTKNLLTARLLLECYLKHLIAIQFFK